MAWGISRPAIGTSIVLHLSDVGALPAVVTRHIGEVGLGAQFEELDAVTQRVLIAKIFTHAYENHGKVVSGTADRLGVWRRLAGAPRKREVPGWARLPRAEVASAEGRAGGVYSTGVRPDLRVGPGEAYPRLVEARGLRKVA